MKANSARARVHAIISGLVQGVGFRANTTWEARALGVDGWVRNLSGGEVEVEAEGPRPVLEEFVRWLHQGPRGARVTEVQVTWLPYQGDLIGFEAWGWW